MHAMWSTAPPAADPGPADVVGYYELDGVPVLLRADGGLQTAYAQPVDWGEWLYRAVRISEPEFHARVALITPPDAGRR